MEQNFNDSSNPKKLRERFLKDKEIRKESIVDAFLRYYLKPPNFNMLRTKKKKNGKSWLNEVPTLGFSLGENDLNLIKKHFANSLAGLGDVKSPKKTTSIGFWKSRN